MVVCDKVAGRNKTTLQEGVEGGGATHNVKKVLDKETE